MTKSEPILSGTEAAPAARQEPNRSGEAGRKRGVGKMNARLALAFAAANICISQSEIRRKQIKELPLPLTPMRRQQVFTPYACYIIALHRPII